MRVSVAHLINAGLHPTQAKMLAEPLSASCALWGIDTPARVAALLGQCMVESASFTKLEEGLWYRTPQALMKAWPSRFQTEQFAIQFLGEPQKLASYVYSNRNGNGDEASGDGWRFRGSGWIQVTGRGNFRRVGKLCAMPFEEKPELVREPSGATLATCSYWSDAGLNTLADAWNIDRISTVVNRGPGSTSPAHQAVQRKQHSEAALRALSN